MASAMATIDANPAGHKIDTNTFSNTSSYLPTLLPAFEPSTPSRSRQFIKTASTTSSFLTQSTSSLPVSGLHSSSIVASKTRSSSRDISLTTEVLQADRTIRHRQVDLMSISSSVYEAQLPLPAQVSIKTVSIPHYCKNNGKWFYACRVVPDIVQLSSLSYGLSHHTTSSRRRESLGKMELAGCGRLGASEPYTVFRSWSSFVELSQELAIAFPIISPYAYCSSGIPPTNYSKETPRLNHKRFPAWPASSTKTLIQRQADLERFVIKLFELPDVIRESSLVREFFAVDQVMSPASLDLKKEQEEQGDIDTNPVEVETFTLPISQAESSSLSSSSIVPQSVLTEFQRPYQSQTALSRRRLVTKRSSPDLRRRGCEEFGGKQLNTISPSPPLPLPIGFSMRSIISPTALLQQDIHRQLETELSSTSSSETASFASRQHTYAAHRPIMKDILNSGLMLASDNDNDNDNEDDYNPSHDLNPIFLSMAHREPIQSEIVTADLPPTTTTSAATMLPPPKKGFGGRTLRHFRSLQDLRQQSHNSTSQERTLAPIVPLPKNAAASISMARAQTLPEAFQQQQQQQQQRTLSAQAQVRSRRAPLCNFSSPSSSAFASIPSTPISDKTSPILMTSKLAISEFSNSRQQPDSDSLHHPHRKILHGRSTKGSISSMSSFDEVWRTHSSSGSSSSSSSGGSSMLALSPTTTASSSMTTPGSFRHLPCGRLDRVPLSATSSPPLIPMTFPSLQQHQYQIRGDNGVVAGHNGLERKRRPSMPSRSSSISKMVPSLPLRNRSYSGTDSHHTPSPSTCSLDSMMSSIGGDAVCMGGRGGGVTSIGSRATVAAPGAKNGGGVEMHRSMSDGTGGCSYDSNYSSPSTFPNIRKPSDKSQNVTTGSTGQYKSSSTTAPNSSSSSSTFDSPMTLKNNCVPPPPFFPLPPSMTGGTGRVIGHRSRLPLQQQQQLLVSSSAMTSAYSQDGMPHPPRHASRTGNKYEAAAPAEARTTAGDNGKDSIDFTDSSSSLSMMSLSSSSSLTNSSSPISPISPGSPNFGYTPLLTREKALGGNTGHPTAGQNQLTRHRQQSFHSPESQLHQGSKLTYTFKILHQNSNIILRVSSVNCTLKLLRESVENKFLESSIVLSTSLSSSSSSTLANALCSKDPFAAVTTAQNSQDEDELHVNVNEANTEAGANADLIEMTSWKLAYMSPSISSSENLAHTPGRTAEVTLDKEKERKGGNTTTSTYKHNEPPSLHITISKDQPTPTKLPTTSLEYITTEKAFIQLLERTDHLNKIPLHIII